MFIDFFYLELYTRLDPVYAFCCQNLIAEVVVCDGVGVL